MNVIVMDETGRDEVRSEISSLLDGFEFDAVTYLIPSAMAGAELTLGTGFEHAEAGVSLVGRDGGRRTIRWAQRGFDEGLWVGEAQPSLEGWWAPEVESTVVTSWERRGLGHRVLRTVLGWQPLGSSRSSIWTVRLELDRGSVAVALGERSFESGELTYIPDCVVVIFDEGVARNYAPPGSPVSAWAERR